MGNYYDLPSLKEVLLFLNRKGIIMFPSDFSAPRLTEEERDQLFDVTLEPLNVAMISGVHLLDNPRSLEETTEHKDHEHDAQGG